MPLTKFAWLVHCNDEGVADSKWHASLNWVMPWGVSGAQAWPELDPEAAPNSSSANNMVLQLGDLLWPWKLKLGDWYAVHQSGAGYTLTRLASLPTSPALDAFGVQGRIEAEIKAKTGACLQPFSAAAAYLPDTAGRGASSFPHAFAPLSHLPSPVAQDVLGMCTTVQFDAAAQASCLALAPAISAAAPGGIFTLTPMSVVQAHGIFTITYEVRDAAGAVAMTELAFQVVTKSLDPARAMNQASVVACVLDGAESADVGVRENLVSKAFSPLEVVAPCLAQIVAQYPAQPPAGFALRTAESVLAQSLGWGEIRRETVVRAGFADEVRHVGVWEHLEQGNEARSRQIADWVAANGLPDDLFAEMRDHIHRTPALPTATRTALAPLVAALDLAQSAAPGANSFISGKGQAIIAATALLLGAEDARQLWASWLATLAMRFGKSSGDPFWKTPGDFAAWHRRILGILDDHTVATLLADQGRRALAAPLIANPALLTESEVDSMAGRFAELVAAMLSTPTDPALAALLTPQAKVRMTDLRQGLVGKFGADTTAPLLGDDRDLAITLLPGAANGDQDNQALRGFAVAMAAGYVAAEAKLHWQWLTNVAGQVWDGRNWLPMTAGGKLLRLSDTVGATKVNGRDVVAFVYSGLPLNGRLNSVEDDGDSDADGTDALDFFWPEDTSAEAWLTPRLGYGLQYWAVATPIGNAGRVLDPRYAAPADDRSLAQLKQGTFAGATPIRYLCRVAPGTPVISLAHDADGDAYELADECRTRTYLAGLGAAGGANDQQRIALIRPAHPDWIRGKDKVSLVVRAPDGTPNVVERWLEADCARHLVGGPAEDPAVAGMDLAAILDAQARYRKLLKPVRADSKQVRSQSNPDNGLELERRKEWPRHPAVRAFGITVQLFKPDGSVHGGPVKRFIAPGSAADRGYVAHAILDIGAGTTSAVGAVSADHLGLTLAPGCFAKIEACSLAPEWMFAGPDGHMRMSDVAGSGPWVEMGRSYRSFEPAVHWVECLSMPGLAGERALVLDQLAERLCVSVDANKVIAEIGKPSQPLDASWLKGFLVQRHEWHWTGYPVAFPRSGQSGLTLFDWAEPFMGTESLRESHVDQVHLQLDKTDGWYFAGPGHREVLATATLPSDRGAKYIAFVVRPVRRFDRWLKRWNDIDTAILGTGLLLEAKLRWDDPSLRLSPPDLKAAVPLVRTFATAHGAGAVVSTANGCMLCLRDVLYRTDDMARVGGVSEFIDVQLEETRFNEVYEIGPNPVFHAGPSSVDNALMLPYPTVFAKSGAAAHQDAEPFRKMDWRLTADRPFGLSNDLDRNSKVAQTAIIVRPGGTDVANYWVMAKVKLRRMYDPDPLWTTPSWVPADPKAHNTWNLGRRSQGDDWIPHDFCVELPGGATLTSLKVTPGPALDLPPVAQAGLRARYLCTWHKGQWANTDQSIWGLQVQFQQLSEDKGQWQTTMHFSPYETHDKADDPMDIKNPAPVLLKMASGASLGKQLVTRLLVSDYSEPHWLTFIGMPFRAVALANEAYWLTEKAGKLALMRSNKASGNIDLRKEGEPVSRDLLIIPVDQADFGPSGAGVRREDAERNSFHLLLVFKRVDDMTASAVGMPLGQLVGAYKPKRAPITDADPYPPLKFESFMAAPSGDFPDHADCTGFIYRFHTPHDDYAAPIKHWEDLQAQMFPVRDSRTGEGYEAAVRWTPEYIGPLSVVAEGKWPNQIARPAGVEGIRIEIRLVAGDAKPKKKHSVEIIVDPAVGWRVKAKIDANKLVPDDIVSGTCNVGDDLELCLSGGRLLARLEGWTPGLVAGGAAKSAVVFDDGGKRLPETFTWATLG